MQIKVIKFDNYKKPNRAHYNDSGADVFASRDVIIKAHSAQKVPTGVGLELPDGYDAIIHSKSGLSSKGIICANAPIDAGYKGEIHALIINVNDYDFEFKAGEKVGQLVIRPVVYADFVDEFGDQRGAAGFGSTGK